MKRYLANELQNPDECAEFVALLVRDGVRSYLEIGSRFGGSLWQVAQALPKGSRLVSVDVESKPELETCLDDIRSLGHEVHQVIGDSTAPEIVASVRELGPFDAVLIDGNHTKEYVNQDWANYGPVGRIVAFHDVGTPKAHKPWRKAVPELWNAIRSEYENQEIRVAGGIGFGVLWR